LQFDTLRRVCFVGARVEGNFMRTLLRVVRKWWPGLIPLAALWGLAAWFNTVPFETDLATRTALSLRETILDKTRVEAAGRDLTVTADAFSEEGRRSSVAIAEAVPGCAAGARPHAHHRRGQAIRMERRA
jgi:hypothetical protein